MSLSSENFIISCGGRNSGLILALMKISYCAQCSLMDIRHVFFESTKSIKTWSLAMFYLNYFEQSMSTRQLSKGVKLLQKLVCRKSIHAEQLLHSLMDRPLIRNFCLKKTNVSAIHYLRGLYLLKMIDRRHFNGLKDIQGNKRRKLGDSKDVEKQAMLEFRYAADKGDVLAAEKYGCYVTSCLVINSYGAKPAKEYKTNKWLTLACDANMPVARYYMGRHLELTNELLTNKMIVNTYVFAAERNHRLAIEKMAAITKMTNDTKSSRVKNYSYWLVKGAHQGNAEMQMKLGWGILFLNVDNGINCSDITKLFQFIDNHTLSIHQYKHSLYWFGRAGKQGHHEAQVCFGFLVILGKMKDVYHHCCGTMFNGWWWNPPTPKGGVNQLSIARDWLTDGVKRNSLLAIVFVGYILKTDILKKRKDGWIIDHNYNNSVANLLLKIAASKKFVPAINVLISSSGTIYSSDEYWLKFALTCDYINSDDKFCRERLDCAMKLGMQMMTQSKVTNSTLVDVAAELAIAGSVGDYTEDSRNLFGALFHWSMQFHYPRDYNQWIGASSDKKTTIQKRAEDVRSGDYIIVFPIDGKELVHGQVKRFSVGLQGGLIFYISLLLEGKTIWHEYKRDDFVECFTLDESCMVHKILISNISKQNYTTTNGTTVSLHNTILSRALMIHLNKIYTYQTEIIHLLSNLMPRDILNIIKKFLGFENEYNARIVLQKLPFSEQLLLTHWDQNYQKKQVLPMWSEQCLLYLNDSSTSYTEQVIAIEHELALIDYTKLRQCLET